MSLDYEYEILKRNKNPEEIQKIYEDLTYKAKLICGWEMICN